MLRLSKYNNFFEYNDSVIIYNALTQNHIFAPDITVSDAMKTIADSKALGEYQCDDLKDKGIVTDLSEDEEQAVSDSVFYTNCHNGVLRITLVTTMACNFDCQYCAQKHDKHYMKKEIYDDVFRFIIKNTNKFHKLKLVLFGGEPTLAFHIYHDFLQKLKDSMRFYKKQVEGVMITNGYLLNREMLRKLYALNITQFQITLDASPQYHDLSRRYLDGTGTFHIVHDNLVQMTKEGDLSKLSVLIMINTTSEMLENIDIWKKNFDVFSTDSRFMLMLNTVEDRGGPNIKDFGGTLITVNDQRYIYALNKLSKHLFFNDKIKVNTFVCESVRELSHTIDWNGDIRACSQLTGDNVIGNISSGGKLNIDKRFPLFQVKTEKICHTCTIEPLCHGKSCALKFSCNKEMILGYIYHQIVRNIQKESAQSFSKHGPSA